MKALTASVASKLEADPRYTYHLKLLTGVLEADVDDADALRDGDTIVLHSTGIRESDTESASTSTTEDKEEEGEEDAKEEEEPAKGNKINDKEEDQEEPENFDERERPETVYSEKDIQQVQRVVQTESDAVDDHEKEKPEQIKKKIAEKVVNKNSKNNRSKNSNISNQGIGSNQHLEKDKKMAAARQRKAPKQPVEKSSSGTKPKPLGEMTQTRAKAKTNARNTQKKTNKGEKKKLQRTNRLATPIRQRKSTTRVSSTSSQVDHHAVDNSSPGDSSVASVKSTISIAHSVNSVKLAAADLFKSHFDADAEDDSSTEHDESSLESSDMTTQEQKDGTSISVTSAAVEEAAESVTHSATTRRTTNRSKQSTGQKSSPKGKGKAPTYVDDDFDNQSIAESVKSRRRAQKRKINDEKECRVESPKTTCSQKRKRPTRRSQPSKDEKPPTDEKVCRPSFKKGDYYYTSCWYDGHRHLVKIVDECPGLIRQVIMVGRSNEPFPIKIGELTKRTPELDEEQKYFRPANSNHSVCSDPSRSPSSKASEDCRYGPPLSIDEHQLKKDFFYKYHSEYLAGSWTARGNHIVYFCHGGENPKDVADKFPTVSVNKIIYDNKRRVGFLGLRKDSEFSKGTPVLLPKVWGGKPVVLIRNDNPRMLKLPR